MRLRTKLTLISMGLTLLGVALGLGLTYWLVMRVRLAYYDSVHELFVDSVLELILLDPEDAPGWAERHLASSNVSAVQAYRNGQLLWVVGASDAPTPLSTAMLSSGSTAYTVNSWRVYTLHQDGLVIQVGRPLNMIPAVLLPHVATMLSLVVALVVASGLLAWLAAKIALHPLETLTETVRGYHLGTQFPTVRARDEAAVLANSFAALLTRLERERERERSFLAYAAHELRTPISALRAKLELNRWRKGSPGPELLGQLHRDALRLEALAQNLLALSRAEAGELHDNTLDLADTVDAAYDRFLPLALEAGHELVLESGSAVVRADPRLLDQALNNLLANAIHHVSDGPITLRSGLSGGRAFLEVADSGPGLPNPIPEGLGLRVAKAVAEAHGGTVEVNHQHGTSVRLWLSDRAGELEAPLTSTPWPEA